MNSPPLEKKRRLAMPEFESSFDVGADRRNPPNLRSARKTPKLFDKSHELHGLQESNASEERVFGGAIHVETPAKTSQATKAHSVFPSFEIPLSSVDRIKPGRNLPPMSAAFADFSSNFGLKKKNKHNVAITPATAHHEGGMMVPTQLGSRIQKPTNILKVPLRVFEPPQLPDMRQEASAWNHTRKLITPTTPKIDAQGTRKITSVTPHLLSLKPNVAPEAPHATPKKSIGSLAPNVPLAKATFTFTPSKVSCTERADRIAQSVHDDHKSRTAEMPFSDFIRGMDISPQKDHGERRKGGLAERAQHMLLKSSTNLTLWQTERDKDAGYSKPPKGDLHLRIISILSYTYHPTGIYQHQPSTANPRTVLTTCYILDSNSEVEPKLVVFLIPPNKRNGGIHTGKEVYVWRPWNDIRIPRVDEEVCHTEGSKSESLTTDTRMIGNKSTQMQGIQPPFDKLGVLFALLADTECPDGGA
ncbi:hypothetical protein Clacol_003261 [Clathrus columnatus]|uniref:Uncharacterized protein n=1 Tax=Clathrus columnatus TaxID=1419009 RepID=A0AAV5A8H3_9AGAM|nr:hypothetical protein Clacol_003261 [Clathrus columnatus]